MASLPGVLALYYEDCVLISYYISKPSIVPYRGLSPHSHLLDPRWSNSHGYGNSVENISKSLRKMRLPLREAHSCPLQLKRYHTYPTLNWFAESMGHGRRRGSEVEGIVQPVRLIAAGGGHRFRTATSGTYRPECCRRGTYCRGIPRTHSNLQIPRKTEDEEHPANGPNPAYTTLRPSYVLSNLRTQQLSSGIFAFYHGVPIVVLHDDGIPVVIPDSASRPPVEFGRSIVTTSGV